MDENRDGGKPSGFLRRVVARFGNIARGLGLAEPEDVDQALRLQEERRRSEQPHKKIGAILVEQGKMTDGHVQQVLQGQKEVEEAKLMSPEEVREHLEARTKRLAAEKAERTPEPEKPAAEAPPSRKEPEAQAPPEHEAPPPPARPEQEAPAPDISTEPVESSREAARGAGNGASKKAPAAGKSARSEKKGAKPKRKKKAAKKKSKKSAAKKPKKK